MFSLFKNKKGFFNEDYKAFKKKYTDNDFSKNRILTNEISMSLDSKKTGKNNNVFLLTDRRGADNYIKANILQGNSNYIIPDPGGDIYNETKYFLETNGYKIHVLNLRKFDESLCYNPLMNMIKTKNGFYESSNLLVDTFIRSTNHTNEVTFYERCEAGLLNALILHIKETMPREKHNFSTVVELLGLIDFEKENILEKIDEMFEKSSYITEYPKKYYKIFKDTSKKTLKGIIVSLAIRLQIFSFKPVKNITESNTIDFQNFDNGKQVIFIITHCSDNSFYPITNMFYAQLIENLYSKAEHSNGLNQPIMCIVNNFFLDLPTKLQTSPKYNIQWSIICHSLAELKYYYKEDWEAVIYGCDSLLYMINNNIEDFKNVSRFFGEDIITVRRFYSGVEVNEKLDTSKCLLKIRGFKTFICTKYDPVKHSNYKYLKQ